MKNNISKTRKITYFAILTALAIVLQLTLGQLTIMGVVKLNFTLVIIVVCAMILGTIYAGMLGAIVGVVILLNGVIGVDGFTNVLFAEQPVIITLTCILKTALAGVLSGVVFNLFREKNRLVGAFVSATVAPIVNTGVFVFFMLLIKQNLINSGFIDGGKNAFITICVSLVGINFIFEILLSILLAPAVYRVVTIVDKSFREEKE